MTPPDLILFTAFGGDWARYENELYDIFISTTVAFMTKI